MALAVAKPMASGRDDAFVMLKLSSPLMPSRPNGGFPRGFATGGTQEAATRWLN